MSCHALGQKPSGGVLVLSAVNVCPSLCSGHAMCGFPVSVLMGIFLNTSLGSNVFKTAIFTLCLVM